MVGLNHEKETRQLYRTKPDGLYGSIAPTLQAQNLFS